MNLNVISFNIQCWDAPNGNSILERAPRVRKLIVPRKPDLIGFQEATPVWLEILNRDYGDNYEIYNVYRSEDSPESTPIAWNKERFQSLDRGNLWYSDTPEVESAGWDEIYKCPRIFTWVRLKEKSTGREFCFASTHFGFGDTCQRKSAQILISFARRMGCPCVITGDFNMEISSAAYGEITQFLEDVNVLTVDDRGPTFHGFDPELYGEHIDYCFVTPDVRPLSFEVLRELVDGKYPSDHYGLFASVELEAAP